MDKKHLVVLTQILLLFAISAAIFWRSPVSQVADSHYSVLLSEHLLRHGNLDLDRYFVRPLNREDYPGVNKVTGYPYHVIGVGEHVRYYYPVGSSLLSVPFVATLNAVGISSITADERYDRDGEVLIQRTIATLLMAGLAAIFFVTARLLLPPGWSLVVALGGAFGTQVWSTASRALWSHTWGIFLVGVAVLLLIAHERRVWRAPHFVLAMLLATVLAWAAFSRATFLVPLAAVSVYLLVRHRDLLPGYALGCAAWLVPYIVASQMLYGRTLQSVYSQPREYVPVWSGEYLIGLAGHLVSPSRGLLVYLPVLLFAAYLLARYRARLPLSRLGLLALGVIAAHTGAVSTWADWWGGIAYGPRLLTELVPWFVLLGMLGVRAMLDAAPPRGRRAELVVGTLLLVLSVAINARGATSKDTLKWHVEPASVNVEDRLWDWSAPQFLAGLRWPPLAKKPPTAHS
jgi:hypothetical protein